MRYEMSRRMKECDVFFSSFLKVKQIIKSAIFNIYYNNLIYSQAQNQTRLVPTTTQQTNQQTINNLKPEKPETFINQSSHHTSQLEQLQLRVLHREGV